MSEIFQERQAQILSFIQQGRLLLHTIYSAHQSDKFPLLYPRVLPSPNEVKQTRGPSSSRTSKVSDLKVLSLPDELTACEDDIEENTLGRLLGARLSECITYLDRLYGRVGDKSSRILVTGDVNSGKSTFVNALLRQDLLPTDQQPCTQCFCEVVPLRGPDSCIKIYGISEYESYHPEKSSTFDVISLEEMQGSVQNEDSPYQFFRMFIPDTSGAFSNCKEMNVSVIDSPGLNSDLFKTMALFSKQEDIDVIVFVINAANHLTLSAREFLDAASREKAYVFIAVNKIDDIRNIEKCKRLVLSQIQEVLPKTYEERSELVHFISAGEFLKGLKHAEHPSSASSVSTQRITPKGELKDEFIFMEQCLQNFILNKRTRSKLLPAQTYLLHLLGDISGILEYNQRRRIEELHKIQHELEIIAPCYDELMAHNGNFQADLTRAVLETSQMIYVRCQASLVSFSQISSIVKGAPWRGLTGIFGFRDHIHRQVRQFATQWVTTTRHQTFASVVEGIHLLNGIAVSHAKQTFTGTNSPAQPIIEEESMSVELELDDLIPVVSLVELFNASMILRASTWISALTLAGATFGYQHLLALALRVLDLSRFTGRIVSLSVAVAASGIAVVALLGDVESIVRSGVEQHYTNAFKCDRWSIEPARLLEEHACMHLNSHKNGLVSRFEAALHEQRQLRAEKDLARCLNETMLTFLGQQLQSTQSLLSAVNRYLV